MANKKNEDGLSYVKSNLNNRFHCLSLTLRQESAQFIQHSKTRVTTGEEKNVKMN